MATSETHKCRRKLNEIEKNLENSKDKNRNINEVFIYEYRKITTKSFGKQNIALNYDWLSGINQSIIILVYKKKR